MIDFSRRGLSLDRMRSFLAVVDAGSIARAAPGDPVRQSQISRQISELEAFFGQALIDRRTVTAAGRQLAVTVRETLAGLSDVSAQRAPLEIQLGAGDSVLHAWLIPRMPALDASVVLAAMHGGEVVSRLREARLDFGVAARTHVGRDLRARTLGTLELALFVPKALRRRTAAEVLASVPTAVVYGDPEVAAALEIGAIPALRCETFPQAQRAVATGRFAAVLPALARRDLPASAFERLPMPSLRAREFVLAWHPRLERQRPRVAALVPALAEAFALP
jgi:DNA-binding transcriptional LysR family regulator